AEWPAELRHLSGRVRLHRCDLADPTASRALIREVEPDQIYHLAGYANAGRSLQEPAVAWSANLTATLNLYDAVTHWGGRPRILYVGSGLIYGDCDGTNGALDERCPLHPVSPYAASKA